MIPIFQPSVPPSVVDRVCETLCAGWLSEGRQVRVFEEAFCRKFGLPHALALNSGTAALHLMVPGARLGHGNEVITTTQTCVV
jgi:dTDP-4-amino-4,6-dideoxygalactose transaminase